MKFLPKAFPLQEQQEAEKRKEARQMRWGLDDMIVYIFRTSFYICSEHVWKIEDGPGLVAASA